MHYRRWLKHGDPTICLVEKDFEKRFWANTKRDGECWLWQGRIARNGYGQCRNRDQRNVGAHRVAWELVHGEIPDGAHVCHKCDVRNCVNPDHLFVGDAKANMADMITKGRDKNRKGERHHSSKLAEQDIAEIRSSKETAVSLAPRYGVSVSTICRARKGETWSSA